MSGRGRAGGAVRWLLIPVRQAVSLRVLVVLALLSTLSSVLLGQAGGGGGEGGRAGPPPPPDGESSQSTDGNEQNGGREEDGEEVDEDEQEAREEFERLIAEQREQDALNRGVISAFDVRDSQGSPVSTYRVYADVGGWTDWQLKVQDFLVQICFQLILWIISFCCWLIAWAFAFSLAALMFRPVLSIADSLHSNILVQMGLPGLFLAVAMVTAAWHLFFGVKSRGWGEAAAALTVSALAVGALASPPELLLDEREGVVGAVQQLAVEIAGVVIDPGQGISPAQMETPEGWEEHQRELELGSRTPDLPGNAAAVTQPITDALVDAFIARPAQLLSYGQVFNDSCSQAFRDMQVAQRVYENVLEEQRREGDPVGAWIDDQIGSIPGIGGFLVDWRQRQLESIPGYDENATVDEAWQDILDTGPIQEFEETCVDGSAQAAKRASWDKVGGGIFALIAALITACFVLALVGAFLSAQVWLAIEAILAKLALVIGVLPGVGRSWLVARATEIMRRLLLMITSTGALAVFIVIITELVNAPDDVIPGGIATRFLVIDIACVAGLIYRKRLTYAARSVAERARARIGRSPLAGEQPGTSPSAGFQRPHHGLLRTAADSVAVAAYTGRAVRGAASLTRRSAGVVRKTAGGLRRRPHPVPGQAERDGRGTPTGTRRPRIQTGLPEHMPADAAELRDRIERMRRQRARRGGPGTRPADGRRTPAGAQHAAQRRQQAAARNGRAPAPPPTPVRHGSPAPGTPRRRRGGRRRGGTA